MQGRTIFATLGEGLLRWIAAFGACPTPSRDPGLCVWAYLRSGGTSGPPLLAGPLLDDPHLPMGSSL